MSEAKQYKYIGQRTIRPDGFDKVTGRANYGADLSLPGMIWGKILRSPHAHALITKLDTSRAEAHPDVLAIAGFEDFPSVNAAAFAAGNGDSGMLDLARNILADKKVLYHGHAIVAVAARTEEAAAQALQLIDVEYEVLPPVMSIEQAIKDDAAVLHDDMFTQGLAVTPITPSNIATRMELKKGDVAAGCRKRHRKCTPTANSELAMRSRVSPSTGPLAGLTTSCVMVVRYSKRATDAAAVYCWPLSESCSGAKPVSAEGGITHVALGEPGTGTAFTGESAPKRQNRLVPPSRWAPCSCTIVPPAAWPTAGLSESTRGSSYC